MSEEQMTPDSENRESAWHPDAGSNPWGSQGRTDSGERPQAGWAGPQGDYSYQTNAGGGQDPSGNFSQGMNQQGPAYDRKGRQAMNGADGLPPTENLNTPTKQVGFSVINGIIVGIVASVIILLSSALVIPPIIKHAVTSAASEVTSQLESSRDSKSQLFDDPDSQPFKQTNPDDDDLFSGSDEDANSDSESDSNGDTNGTVAAPTGGFLGVTGMTVSDAQEQAADSDEDYSDYPDGVLVTSVISGSPASMAGLKTNDVITSVDGQTISTFDELKSIISSHQPGDKVTLTIERKNGKEFKTSTHDATLVEYPDTTGQDQ